MANYGYYIDLHERGSFIADVRSAQTIPPEMPGAR